MKDNFFKRFVMAIVNALLWILKTIGKLLVAIGKGFVTFVQSIGNFFKNCGIAIVKELKEFGHILKYGDFRTRLSLVIMGAGNFLRGQVVRGLFYLAFEGFFIWYMITRGAYWLYMLPSLGEVGPTLEYNEFLDTYVSTYNDNSFQILLYGVLSIFLIVALIITWRMSLGDAFKSQQLAEKGKKLPHIWEDIRSLFDEKFYKTLLTLPVIGITIFTVLPLAFMILVAFTNYDGTHDGYVTNLFTWVGWDNFKTMLGFNGAGSESYAGIFGNMLGWTVIWAFFATFTNYFLGILVALMINKKGIKLKKMWRTILVMTIAIPQFISLMYVAKMFDESGIVNGLLINWGLIKEPILFWGEKNLARVMVILINIWIGIPYLMIMTTGILMNIPEDLYESAKIDGANPVQQFFHITMPYLMFITGPYLLTSFTGNMNNFNVIYLLTAGGPTNSAASSAAGSVGYTDLLITWLFKITQGAESKFYMASVIGILMFVIVAVITLFVYNMLPSNKNEEDLQ